MAKSGGSKLKPHEVTKINTTGRTIRRTRCSREHHGRARRIPLGGRVSDLEVTDGIQRDLCYIVRFKPDGERQEVVVRFPRSICGDGVLLRFGLR